jgi:hypothetical protein
MIHTLLLPSAVALQAAAAVSALGDAPGKLTASLILLALAATASAWWLRMPREWSQADERRAPGDRRQHGTPAEAPPGTVYLHRRPASLDNTKQTERLTLLESAQRASDEQFGLIRSEFEQLRGILGDATSNLSTSLTGVDEAADGQRRHLRQLVEELLAIASEGAHEEQTQGIHRFARQSDAIVSRLVNSLNELSHHGANAGNAFSALLERVEDILHHTREVDAINEQINLLATHTAIDSARASDEGRQLARIAMDVRNLAERTRRFSAELRRVIEDAHTQAHRVELEVTRLRHLDLNVAAEARDEVRRMGELMRDLNDRAVDQYERVTSITQLIRQHVFSGVMSLQFEDLMRQLMEHVEQRVISLEMYTTDVLSLQRRVPLDDRGAQNWLNELQQVVENADKRFAQHSHKAVAQQNLDEGDAEMF